MKVIIDSQIRIKDISKDVEQFIKKELKFPNPQLQKMKSMGFWTGNLQKEIKLYTKNGSDYILPMGCLKDIWKLHPYKEDYTIDFGEPQKIEYPKLKFDLFPYQNEAVENMIKVKRGILQAPCGSRQIYLCC